MNKKKVILSVVFLVVGIYFLGTGCFESASKFSSVLHCVGGGLIIIGGVGYLIKIGKK